LKWENFFINGISDIDGNLTPFRNDDYWCPEIDIDNGLILNWSKDTIGKIHYKVCDDGEYSLVDSNGSIVLYYDGYVPKILDMYGESYGDYLIMLIDSDGKIDKWNPNSDISDFENN